MNQSILYKIEEEEEKKVVNLVTAENAYTLRSNGIEQSKKC